MNETRWQLRWAIDPTLPAMSEEWAPARSPHPMADELLAEGWEPFATVGATRSSPPVVYFRRRVEVSATETAAA
jgi:hypothetical protein